MADVWGLVPTLTTTEALCLLALHHIEAHPDDEDPLALPHVEVQAVAATTGLSTSTAGASLRSLAKAGHLQPVPYLATASNGRPCARVGYRSAVG